MTTHPILFSAPMVRALLDGSKTQTRRVCKPQPIADSKFTGGHYIPATKRTLGAQISVEALYVGVACPYGQVDDLLWVRETFNRTNPHGKDGHYFYRADEAHEFPDAIWKPSIFMPRAASRITLEITGVRVERLQDISESDALAEGISQDLMDTLQSNAEHANQREPTPGKSAYEILWEDINGAGSWDLNPWVWVIEFKKVKP